MTLPPLLLASISPRRRQLLDNLGLSYSVLEPGGTEAHPAVDDVDAITQSNALAKARSVLHRVPAPETVILGADTLVVLEDEVMGKPRDPEDARRMLRRLSGKEHAVVSGIALVSARFGHRGTSVRSRVRFRPLSEAEIADYVGTREPHDKAGAYALQGLGMLFIERIEGSYTNVVGLPVETFLRELEALTGIALPRWFQ